jgi:hypothetical protein
VGSARGVCGPCGSSGSGSPDGGTGVPDGGTGAPDGASPPPPATDAGTCSLYGQLCQSTADCCNGLPCSTGRCGLPVP